MKKRPIDELRAVMARLRGPGGCPWDREQSHASLRFHAVEEVYELLDAIDRQDDQEMIEELGDVLLQVVFHCQLAQERGAFNFDDVCRHLTDKLVRRHPHVFGSTTVRSVEGVWKQWELIKRAEKEGTPQARPSLFDGIPRHLPGLLRGEKLIKKARKAGLDPAGDEPVRATAGGSRRRKLGLALFALTVAAQEQGWSAEEILRAELARREKILRRLEQRAGTGGKRSKARRAVQAKWS